LADDGQPWDKVREQEQPGTGCGCVSLSAMPQALSSIYLHAVFSTKARQPRLNSQELRQDVHAYIGGVSRRLGCDPIAIGGVEDHIHLLVRFGKTISVSDWIKEVKRVSSVYVKDRQPGFSWQAGYGVFAVNQAGLDAAATYVRNQEEHHRKFSFQEEFRILMREQGIEWNESYVWD